MITLNYAEYGRTTTGVEIPKAEFTAIANLAALDIAKIIFAARVNKDNVRAVKTAIAYQAAFLYLNGGAENANAGSAVKSETVGHYTYETANPSEGASAISSYALTALYPTGLLYRGNPLYWGVI